MLEPERKASYTFLDQVLREGKDSAFVAAFDIRVRLLQGFTSSHADLAGALERLRIPDQVSTAIFGAVRDMSERQMRPRKGTGARGAPSEFGEGIRRAGEATGNVSNRGRNRDPDLQRVPGAGG